MAMGRAKRRKKTGARIKKRREALGITQQALAAMMNVSQQQISHWENGTALAADRLLDLAKALDCNVEYLINGSIDS